MSSFLDKAKTVAQQAIDEARKGLDQGQAKLDEYQARRQTEHLLSELGGAVYSQQRWGGDHASVERALAALDEHVRTYGLLGFPDSAVTPGTPSGAAGDAPPPEPPEPPSPPTPPPAG